MNLPPALRIDQDNSLKKYRLTEAQILQGQLLSPETCAIFEHMATEFLLQQSSIEFAGPRDEQDSLMRAHAGLTEKRKLLLQLLQDAEDAYQRIAALSSTTSPN